MNKSILAIIFSFLSFSILTSCDNTAQNVTDAKSDVKEAKLNLDKANTKYEEEIEQFKKEAADKIAANEKSLAEFKARKEADKKAIEADYNKKTDAIEQKNSDLKKKMDDFKFEGAEKWELFKADFNDSVNELGNALSNLTGNDKK